MTLAKLFPVTFQYSVHRSHAAWQVPNPLYSLPIVRFLLAETDALLERNKTTVGVFEWCARLRSDVLHARQQGLSPFEESVCDFIQIYVCIPGIGVGSSSGRMGDAYDWVVRSLNDSQDQSVEQTIEPHRVASAVRAANALGFREALSIVAEWCELAFYVARIRSTLPDACDHLLPIALDAVHAAKAAGDFDVATCCLLSIAGWAGQFAQGRVRPLVQELEQDYVTAELSPALLTRIGVGLATAIGNWSSRIPKAWALDVLARFRKELVGHETVQLLCALVDSIDDVEQLQGQILLAAEENCAQMRAQTPDKISLRYGNERLFTVLKPILTQLIFHGKAEYLAKLLCVWYGISEPKRWQDLLFVAVGEQATHWFSALESVSVPAERPVNELIVDMTSRLNDFLGMTLTVEGEREFAPVAPRRQGVPSEANAEELKRVMLEFYGLNSTTLAAAPFNDARAMVVLPHMMAPLQAALCITSGRTFPLSVSLQQPAVDREVKRMVLWMGGTFTDEIEAATVAALLGAQGIEVVVISGETRTKERFLEIYASEAYDLIWVTAHGEYDHFQPHQITIGLAGTEHSVSLQEFDAVQVPQTGRRLLVLNICDGATGAVLGGALGLGMSQLIASRHQAVISHMWPVDQRISAAFAALLARELAQGESYFKAYCRTVKYIAAGKEALLEEIRLMGPDAEQLAERVANRNFDPSSIYFYGSAVFLE